MVHELKIWPEYFEAVCNGTKTFELRRNDRGFQVGDTLILKEWKDEYTGRQVTCEVSYILPMSSRFPAREFFPDYVIMSIIVNRKEN